MKKKRLSPVKDVASSDDVLICHPYHMSQWWEGHMVELHLCGSQSATLSGLILASSL